MNRYIWEATFTQQKEQDDVAVQIEAKTGDKSEESRKEREHRSRIFCPCRGGLTDSTLQSQYTYNPRGSSSILFYQRWLLCSKIIV